MTSVSFMKGTPTMGSVNQNAPFSFNASPGIGSDYGGRPSVQALTNPTMHNSVPEVMVNSTARAPLFVRPFTRGFEKGYSEGDILFVQRDDARASSTHNVVANLPVLNHILRSSKVEKGTNKFEQEYKTMADVLKKWNYYGILNNDMDTGSKWQRLLNVNVRGRSRVARLWAPDGNRRLKKGDMLWLGFYERTAGEGEQFFGPNGIREAIQSGTKYIEVCATMDCCESFKSEKMLYAIPIGIVSQVTMKRPTSTAIRDAHSVTDKCKLLERIEVLIRI